MKWYDIFLTSLINLWRRKLRTALTLVGVMIGTASIVVMVSMGLGLQTSFMEAMGSSYSLTTINVYNDSYYGGNSNVNQAKLDDATIKKFQQIPHVTGVSPMMDVWGLDVQTGKYQSYMSITGVNFSAMESLGLKITEGTIGEPGTGSRVGTVQMVMGRGVMESFKKLNSDGSMRWDDYNIPDLDWLNIKYNLRLISYEWDGTGEQPMKNYKAQMVGLASEPEAYDDHYWRIYMDIGDLKKIIKENRKEFQSRNIKVDEYQRAMIKVDDISNVTTVQKQLTDDGYNANSIMDLIETTQAQMRNIQMLLGGIGAIAMLAAIPGIANTMLMSVYERTREIGIMKVLGCKLGNIRLLFLGEAGLIGLFGGALGLGLSLGLSVLLNSFFATGGGAEMGLYNMRSEMPPWLIALALLFSFMIGVLSGFYPAQRATKLSALAAIRNEA